MRNEGGNALNELKNWHKAKLRETLDWIQKNVPARAVMVCDAYHPQIQAILCNYAAAARKLNISEAAGDRLENCECRGALWKPDDACFNKDGHLLTIDTRKLRWPYLRKIVERGKKFRLQCDMDTVFAELRHSLDCYVTWSARGDEERLEKLEDWADAVYKRCKAESARIALPPPGPEGLSWTAPHHPGSSKLPRLPAG